MLSTLMQTINRDQWIAEAAYFKAEARHFEPGKELDDWLAATIDFSEMLIANFLAIVAEDGPLTMADLRQLAKLIGIEQPEKLLSENDLVHAIQNATKHRPCFRAENNKLCHEPECKWKTECRKLISVWYS